MKLRALRAVVLGMMMTLVVAAEFEPAAPDHRMRRASLGRMVAGTADQPFVRRQLVPAVLRGVDRVLGPEGVARVNRWLGSQRWVRPFVWGDEEGDAVDDVGCELLWFAAFAGFLWVMEGEAERYSGLRVEGWVGERYRTEFALLLAVVVLRLMRDYIFVYDPLTLGFAAWMMSEVRRQRLRELVVVTGVFSLNRELAFIVAGMVFLEAAYRGEWRRGVVWGGALGVEWAAISGWLAHAYRGNPGVGIEVHRDELWAFYLGGHIPSVWLGAAGLMVYGVGVAVFWRSLTTTLKAMQWFVPLWLALHLLWGYPKEWRVFLEVLPGVMLTMVAMGAAWFQRRSMIERG